MWNILKMFEDDKKMCLLYIKWNYVIDIEVNCFVKFLIGLIK